MYSPARAPKIWIHLTPSLFQLWTQSHLTLSIPISLLHNHTPLTPPPHHVHPLRTHTHTHTHTHRHTLFHPCTSVILKLRWCNISTGDGNVLSQVIPRWEARLPGAYSITLDEVIGLLWLYIYSWKATSAAFHLMPMVWDPKEVKLDREGWGIIRLK